MDKKLMVLIGILCCYQLSFANTCPSIQDIKNNHLKGWKLLDSEDNVSLSAWREAQFRNEVAAFTLAEWVQENKNNIIHCYYRDKEGASMEAFFSKDHFMPDNSKKFWYQVSGAMQCAAGPFKCEFKSTAKDSQLAKR